jgi:hypothetical protein
VSSLTQATRSFGLAQVTTSAVAVGLQLAGLYAAVVTFGVLLTIAIYVVGGLAALLQHLTLRRIQ